MHGNTVTASGYKTRPFERVMKEIQGFFDIHQSEGHACRRQIQPRDDGQERHECTGGARALTAEDLRDRYHTFATRVSTPSSAGGGLPDRRPRQARAQAARASADRGGGVGSSVDGTPGRLGAGSFRIPAGPVGAAALARHSPGLSVSEGGRSGLRRAGPGRPGPPRAAALRSATVPRSPSIGRSFARRPVYPAHLIPRTCTPRGVMRPSCRFHSVD